MVFFRSRIKGSDVKKTFSDGGKYNFGCEIYIKIKLYHIDALKY